MKLKITLFTFILFLALSLIMSGVFLYHRQSKLIESNNTLIENSIYARLEIIDLCTKIIEVNSEIHNAAINFNPTIAVSQAQLIIILKKKVSGFKNKIPADLKINEESDQFVFKLDTTIGFLEKSNRIFSSKNFSKDFAEASFAKGNNLNKDLLAAADTLTNKITANLLRRYKERAYYLKQKKLTGIVTLVIALAIFCFVLYVIQINKLTLAKLNEKEEQLEVTLASIGEAVITTDENSQITCMNPHAEILTGWKRSEAIARPLNQVFDVFDEATRKPIANIISKVLSGGKIVETQNHTLLRSKDQREFIIENNASPIRNRGGNIVGSVLVFQDVGERKKSEEKLQRSESRFNKAFFNSPASMMISRLSDGKILEVNESFIALLEYTREELLGKTSYGLGIYADQQQRIKAAIKIKAHGFIHNEEIVFNTKSGNKKDLLVSIESIELDNEPCILSILIDVTGWKKSEASLLATEKKYRKIFENTAEGIYQSTPEGKFIIVNPSMARIFGYESPDEMIAMITDISTQIYADPNERLRMAELIYLHDHVDAFELQALTKTKNIIWIRASIHTVRDTTGNIKYYEGTLTDISDRKQAEETLRKSQEKFSSMVYNISDIITLLDENGIITYTSPSIKQVLGYGEDEIVGRNVFQFIHHDDHTFIANEFQYTLSKTGSGHLVEFRFLNKHGDYIYLEAQGNNQMQNTAIMAAVVISRDITKRKRADEELRLNKRAIESTLEGIIITDAGVAENNITFVNKGFCNITGYPAEEIIGRNCRFLQGIETDPATVERMKCAIVAKENFEGELINYKKDGTPFWNFLRISPIFDEKGNATHFVGFVNDITHRKIAENQIEAQHREILKTNAELDRFVYSTSHDLRSPLTSVLGLLGFIEDESKEPETLEHARMIWLRIKQLDDFVQNILDYSRNNRLDVQIVPIDFKEIVTQVIERLKFIKQAGHIKFNIDVQSEVDFYSDSVRITTIFENMIGNCIKYYNPGQATPYISVTIQVTKKQALITIEDNGIGISSEHHEQIFKMFYRINGNKPGSGLGLYLVKEIVTKLEGTINVDSAPGEGAKFIIALKNIKHG